MPAVRAAVSAGGYPVRDPVGYLAGEWWVSRRIVDLATGGAGTFEGTARFRPTDDGLWYRESGTLEFGSHRGPAWRELGYLRADGPRLRVEFDDGRFFHDLDLTGGRWSVVHPCRDDEYRGEFLVVDADEWWQHWRLTGPAKNHRLSTTFVRRSSERAAGGASGPVAPGGGS